MYQVLHQICQFFAKFWQKNFDLILDLIILLAVLISILIIGPEIKTFFENKLAEQQWQALRGKNQTTATASSTITINTQVDLKKIDSQQTLSLGENPISTPETFTLDSSQSYWQEISQHAEVLIRLANLVNAQTNSELFNYYKAGLSRANSSLGTVDLPLLLDDNIDAQTTFSAKPIFDPNLPTGTWIVAEKIGLEAQIQTTPDIETGLEKGVVMAPGFDEIGQTGTPVIMAAHRYGYLWWWNNDYGQKNSFYYLPNLIPGDIVQVIANQRAWYYEIYDISEGSEISDYQADLILYTCQFLTGENRFFRYARLIDPAEYQTRFGSSAE